MQPNQQPAPQSDRTEINSLETFSHFEGRLRGFALDAKHDENKEKREVHG